MPLFDCGHLTGEIPANLGQLSNLTELNLAKNQLSGENAKLATHFLRACLIEGYALYCSDGNRSLHCCCNRISGGLSIFTLVVAGVICLVRGVGTLCESRDSVYTSLSRWVIAMLWLVGGDGCQFNYFCCRITDWDVALIIIDALPVRCVADTGGPLFQLVR